MPSAPNADIYAETLAVFERGDDPFEPLTTPEVAEALEANRRTVYKRLTKLVERGELRTKEAGARARVWWRAGVAERADAGERTERGHDVTERPRHERELEWYEHVLQTIPDGVWALDSDDRFVMVNDAYCELTGYDREALIGEHATLVTSESVNDAARAFGERMSAGALRDAALEIDLLRADGTTVPVESHFSQYELEDGEVARCGVVRDVTERYERERALAESQRRFRAILENFPNGVVALFDEDLRHLTVGGKLFEGLDLTPEEVEGRIIDEFMPAEMADQVEPHFRAVFDGESSEFEVQYRGAFRTFHAIPIRDGDGDVVAGLGVSQDVTDLRERERQLKAQRQRLATLNHLDTVVRDIAHAVIDQSTRDEIERTVCESLSASDTYEFAWIAEVDQQEKQVVPRTEASVDGYLDGLIDHSSDLYEAWSGGPIGRAIQTGEPQVTPDVFEDHHFEEWQGFAREHGYRSVAGIPIGYEKSLFGVLGLYASSPDAFDGEAREILGQLGDIVGHAIAAAEQKQALMGDEFVELQFQIRDLFAAIGVSIENSGRITFDRTTPVDDGDVLAYGVATDDGIDALEALVAGTAAWKSVSVIDRTPDSNRFVARVNEPPTISLVTGSGGYLVRSVIEDGDSYMTVHLPANVDVRWIIETIRESFPDLVMVARRQVERSRSPRGRIDHILLEALTERQRATLEAAFHAGYFDRHRKCTGAEVADSLGISTSTFHQHLRAAEYKLLDGVVGTTRQTIPSTS